MRWSIIARGTKLDPKNTFAALRIGELLAQTGQRDDALKYLKIALGDSAKNPDRRIGS